MKAVWPVIVAVVAALSGGALTIAAEPLPHGHADFVATAERPVGFCGNGNPHWPGAEPGAVEWWDGTPGWAKVRHRGGMGNGSPPFDDSNTEAEMRVLLDRVPKNIIWKVPVPGWGDSQPVVVGKRIINAYWPHFVVCYDAGTGKELWRDELELCLLPSLQADRETLGPAPDPKEARGLQTLFELGHAMRHLAYTMRDFEGTDPGPAELPLAKKAVEVMGQWRNTLQAAYPKAIAELDFDIEVAKRFIAGEHGVFGFGQAKLAEDRGLLKNVPQFGLDAKRGLVRLAEKACATRIDNGWHGSWCPFQTSSPTSDGEIVVVRFATGQVVACEVATGRRLWAWRDPLVTPSWTYHCPSPRIGREIVVLDAIFGRGSKGRSAQPSLLGIDKRTGKVRWHTPQTPNSGYPSSTPILTDLDAGPPPSDSGLASKGGKLPVVIGMAGDIVRQSDGKVLCKLDVTGTSESYTLLKGNTVFATAKAEEGGRPLTRIFRLSVVSGDEVRAEVVGDIPEISTFRACTAMSDTFLFGRGRSGLDLTTMKLVDYATPMAVGTAEARGVTVAGRYHIFPSYNYFDEKFRSRQDGMCLLTFHVAEVPRHPGDSPTFVSDSSLLGGPEVAADRFFDKHLGGLDKMRQVTPRKWCGRYGSHLPAFFGLRFGGPVPHGDRLYIQSQCFLYCIGPAVKGTPNDDPKTAAAIRAEADAAKLAAYLTHASAQYRFEAVRRLGEVKASLPAEVAETLKKLLVDDAYEEIRAAALVALDACDREGKAGWTALVAGEFAPCYATEIAWARPGHREQQERRKRLPLLFRALGERAGTAMLAARWPQAADDAVQRRALLEVAAALGWRVEPLLRTALDWCRTPPRWRDDHSLRLLPAYFAAIDAAADPAVADTLTKAYPTDWTLYSTLQRHLPTGRLLAWIEPIALASAHPMHHPKVLRAWRHIGRPAVPSMRRVAARMAADKENKLAEGWARAINEAIAEMKGNAP